MNWTRKEVKERAKAALKRNYWKAVFVSFIFVLLSGGAGSSSASSLVNNGRGGKTNEQIVMETDEVVDYVDSIREEADDYIDSVTEAAEESAKRKATLSDMVDSLGDDVENLLAVKGAAVVVAFVIIAIVIFTMVFIALIAIDVFLVNPLWIGAQRFMLKSVDDRGEISELGYTFDHNYLNGVKTTFMRDLYVFLWTLLFIIPGIYKKYQYYMVEFILAENPDMSWQEVLQRSKDMMEGQKWNVFVLDLSFILWHMLSFFTCGISEIVYVTPYVNLTRAALYRKLSRDGWNDTAYISMRPGEAPLG